MKEGLRKSFVTSPLSLAAALPEKTSGVLPAPSGGGECLRAPECTDRPWSVAPHPAPEGSAGEPGSGPESPLQAAPDHEPFRRFSALRAFPPALCVLARVGRNAGTRAVLCACARGQAVRPAWSREWARLPAAPPRPAFAPPLARHFVLRRVLCAWRAGPPRDGRPEVGTTNAQAPGLRCLQVILLPAERRWGLELAAVPKSRCARTRAFKNLVVHRSRCLRDPGMYVDPRVQAPPPLWPTDTILFPACFGFICTCPVYMQSVTCRPPQAIFNLSFFLHRFVGSCPGPNFALGGTR
ncbi:PREDICTED: uncharacterized protein LOC108538234 [Rhinopithecus bieti]|uniref:uncharacterized protein LOC108538234 n=1 Tax=Rhinopithecus bieti TaxID=61621 RepID=UPI00083BBC53|nr:PREDICTED: uncharacterized protein LOC108538234 [Rhinopithecus bieti]